jgi:chromosome segregation ATPase
MVSDRLVKIKKKLELLYEQLDSLENDVLTNQNPRARTQSKQQIREEIQPQIEKYEAEYLQVLHQESATLTFNEADAQAVIDVVAQEVTRIESNASEYPDELLQQVREIRSKLEQPGTPAALKVKPVISLLPLGIGLAIEGELDTENFLRKHFPTFTRLVKGAKK